MSRYRLSREEQDIDKKVEILYRINSMLSKIHRLKPPSLLTDDYIETAAGLEYIKKNPGTSKEGVVRGMDGNPSRITVLKILDKLAEYELIITTKDKPNSQILHLYINEKDLFVSVAQNLDDFKRAFFILLNKTIEKVRQSSPDGIVEILSLLYGDYILFYYQILGLHITYGVVSWSHRIKDRETMNKLYAVIFSRIVDIQLKLFDIQKFTTAVINKHNGLEEELNNLIPRIQFVASVSLLTPKFMGEVVEKSKNYGLSKEVETVLDIAWKIGYDISAPEIDVLRVINYMSIKGKKGPLADDWRKIVGSWMEMQNEEEANIE